MHEFFRPPENAGNVLKFLFVGFILGCNTRRQENNTVIELKDTMPVVMFFYALWRFSGTMEERISNASFTAIGMAAGYAMASTLMASDTFEATSNNPKKSL